MRICFVDEAGSGQTVTAGTDVSPVFVVVGIVFDQDRMETLTHDFLKLKRRFFPGLFRGKGPYLSGILVEVKASDLRSMLRSGARRKQRMALGFINKLMQLAETHAVAMFGRVWIKVLDEPVDELAVYTFSMQDLCTTFNHLLEDADDTGIVIADSRSPYHNVPVAHAVFTQRFKTGGDEYPRLQELPTFGHSNNHAGLQIADLFAGVILAMASRTYCEGYIVGPHVDPSYDLLKTRFGARLRTMQHRYQDGPGGRWRGGLVVDDRVGKRRGGLIFG